MKVTYLAHSGILVELKDYYCIFDYYKGELPLLDKEKDVIVFCSHSHNDHYNPLIFDLLNRRGMRYQAILANDISDENRLSKIKLYITRRLEKLKVDILMLLLFHLIQD